MSPIPSPPPPQISPTGDLGGPLLPVPPHDGPTRPAPAPPTMPVSPHDGPTRPDPAPPVSPHDPELAPQHMKGLVSLVDKLQRACTALADQGEKSALPANWNWEALPSVAVVGVQGAGKSSVLECLVGKDFLPKSITCRPLIVKLYKIAGIEEYALFSHQPSKKYTCFAEVKTEIANCSNEISAIPIHLSIFSPDVVSLTLVDLPGLRKVAVDVQADNTAEEVESMVRAFIEKPETILLAVSPANDDLATSLAIKISQEVDPDGVRTFGVLTKIDLMDEGTDAVNVLEGRTYPRPYRWTGVLNRTQQDTDMGLNLFAAMCREREFFTGKPEYAHLAHRMGMDHLAKSLSKYLEVFVKSKLAGSKLFSGFDVKSDYKKRLLQGYSLRSFGYFPVYQALTEGPSHDMRYRCIVPVQGKEYASTSDHRHLRDAEEDAATVAYKDILGDDNIDTLLQMVNEANFQAVQTLKEFTIKKGVSEPCYSSSMVHVTGQMTRWLSTVKVDGQVFIGEDARCKQISVRKAASAAITAFLEDGDMLMVSVVQGKRLITAVPTKMKFESAEMQRRKRRKLRHK